MFRKFIHNRKGTAEVIGSVMFVVIIIFFFSSVYLWHDQATKQMNTLLSDKMNSPVEMQWVGNDLQVTNVGGTGTGISRLWITTPAQHIYADFEAIEGSKVWVDPGASLLIKLDGESIPPIDVSWETEGTSVKVNYAPNGDEMFRILTTNGNSATPGNAENGGGGGDISDVIGDFIPDYHSVRWAQVSSGHIVGSWTPGWIYPDSPEKYLVWKIDLKYVGVGSITIDENSMFFFNPFPGQNPGGKAPVTCYIASSTDDVNINTYVGREVTFGTGSKITLYFASSDGEPNTVGGLSNRRHGSKHDEFNNLWQSSEYLCPILPIICH